MHLKVGFLTILTMLLAGPGATLAADSDSPRELDVMYTAKSTGTQGTLQTGPNQRQLMRSYELTAEDGTSLAGAIHALCQQNKIEDTTVAGGATYEGHCTWRDADGDLIFETLNGVVPPNAGSSIFGSGLIVGGTGKFAGITGGLAWASPHDGKNRKRGLYYLPGE